MTPKITGCVATACVDMHNDIPTFTFPAMATSFSPVSLIYGQHCVKINCNSYINMDITDVTYDEDSDDHHQIWPMQLFWTATLVLTLEGLANPEGIWVI